MNKIFKLAAVLSAFCALSVSCEKRDGHGESDAPLENAIEFAGVRSEIRTVLVDVPTNTYYFTTEAGVSTLPSTSPICPKVSVSDISEEANGS